MPNMDGTGPRFACQSMGAGQGHGMGAGHRRHGHGRYCGAHRNAGCMRGLGMRACYAQPMDEKEALTLQKEALQRNLDAVTKRLETL